VRYKKTRLFAMYKSLSMNVFQRFLSWILCDSAAIILLSESAQAVQEEASCASRNSEHNNRSTTSYSKLSVCLVHRRVHG
jgi:hypothetical protein